MNAEARSKKIALWLIAPTWRVRALLRAQLLEEGYDVMALESWEALMARLVETVAAPQMVIVELTGEEPGETLDLLRAIPVPRLVLRASGAPDAGVLRALGVEAVLSRPYSIGEVTRAVRALLVGGSSASSPLASPGSRGAPAA